MHKKTLLTVAGVLAVASATALGTYLYTSPQNPFSASLHQSADTITAEDSSLDFFKSNQARFQSLIEDFKTRGDLSSPLAVKKLRSSAEQKTSTPSYNDYISIKNISMDDAKDQVTFSYAVDVKKLLSKEEVAWCPPSEMAEVALSGSGTTFLTENGNTFLSFSYYLDLEKGSSKGGIRELNIDNKKDLLDTYTFEETLSMQDFSTGEHTLTVVPACEKRYPSRTSLLTPFVVSGPFTKKNTELSGIPKAVAGSGMLRLVSPEMDTGNSGEALTTIPLIASDGRSTQVKVPYIQTSPTLTLRVAIDINNYLRDKYQSTNYFSSMKKERAEGDVLAASVLLFNSSNKLVRQIESPYFSDTILNTDLTSSYMKEVEFAFPALEKDTYQAVMRLHRVETKNGMVNKVLITQSKIVNLGIGDIIMAFGDDETEGKDSISITTPFTHSRETVGHGEPSTDLSGRNIVWSPKHCEMNEAKALCGKEFVAYTSFTKELGEKLSETMGHPVMIINEGIGGMSWTLQDLGEYFKNPSASLSKRIAALQPTGAILTVSGKAQLPLLTNDNGNVEGHLTEALKTAEERIHALLGDSTLPVLIAIPESAGATNDPVLIGAIRAYLSDEANNVYPGADLYSASIAQQGLSLSYSEIANSWAKALSIYLAPNNEKQATE